MDHQHHPIHIVLPLNTNRIFYFAYIRYTKNTYHIHLKIKEVHFSIILFLFQHPKVLLFSFLVNLLKSKNKIKLKKYYKRHFFCLIDIFFKLFIQSWQSFIHMINHFIHNSCQIFNWFIKHFFILFRGIIYNFQNLLILSFYRFI